MQQMAAVNNKIVDSEIMADINENTFVSPKVPPCDEDVEEMYHKFRTAHRQESIASSVGAPSSIFSLSGLSLSDGIFSNADVKQKFNNKALKSSRQSDVKVLEEKLLKYGIPNEAPTKLTAVKAKVQDLLERTGNHTFYHSNKSCNPDVKDRVLKELFSYNLGTPHSPPTFQDELSSMEADSLLSRKLSDATLTSKTMRAKPRPSLDDFRSGQDAINLFEEDEKECKAESSVISHDSNLSFMPSDEPRNREMSIGDFFLRRSDTINSLDEEKTPTVQAADVPKPSIGQRLSVASVKSSRPISANVDGRDTMDVIRELLSSDAPSSDIFEKLLSNISTLGKAETTKAAVLDESKLEVLSESRHSTPMPAKARQKEENLNATVGSKAIAMQPNLKSWGGRLPVHLDASTPKVKRTTKDDQREWRALKESRIDCEESHKSWYGGSLNNLSDSKFKSASSRNESAIYTDLKRAKSNDKLLASASKFEIAHDRKDRTPTSQSGKQKANVVADDSGSRRKDHILNERRLSSIEEKQCKNANYCDASVVLLEDSFHPVSSRTSFVLTPEFADFGTIPQGCYQDKSFSLEYSGPISVDVRVYIVEAANIETLSILDTVSVSGAPASPVTWYRDGFGISLKQSCTLRFTLRFYLDGNSLTSPSLEEVVGQVRIEKIVGDDKAVAVAAADLQGFIGFGKFYRLVESPPIFRTTAHVPVTKKLLLKNVGSIPLTLSLHLDPELSDTQQDNTDIFTFPSTVHLPIDKEVAVDVTFTAATSCCYVKRHIVLRMEPNGTLDYFVDLMGAISNKNDDLPKSSTSSVVSGCTSSRTSYDHLVKVSASRKALSWVATPLLQGVLNSLQIKIKSEKSAVGRLILARESDSFKIINEKGEALSKLRKNFFPDQAATINIRFKPDAIGLHRNHLVVEFTNASKPAMISLTGFGGSPKLRVEDIQSDVHGDKLVKLCYPPTPDSTVYSTQFRITNYGNSRGFIVIQSSSNVVSIGESLRVFPRQAILEPNSNVFVNLSQNLCRKENREILNGRDIRKLATLTVVTGDETSRLRFREFVSDVACSDPLTESLIAEFPEEKHLEMAHFSESKDFDVLFRKSLESVDIAVVLEKQNCSSGEQTVDDIDMSTASFQTLSDTVLFIPHTESKHDISPESSTYSTPSQPRSSSPIRPSKSSASSLQHKLRHAKSSASLEQRPLSPLRQAKSSASLEHRPLRQAKSSASLEQRPLSPLRQSKSSASSLRHKPASPLREAKSSASLQHRPLSPLRQSKSSASLDQRPSYDSQQSSNSSLRVNRKVKKWLSSLEP